MLLASCGAALDGDAVAECYVWTEEMAGKGYHVVLLFEDAASQASVQAAVTPSAATQCLHVGDCSSLDDFVVFSALYAVRFGVLPDNLLRFTGRAFEPLAVQIAQTVHLRHLFQEIDAAMISGDADRAWSALGVVRETLEHYTGTLCKRAYQRAGECKLLIEACRNRHLPALPDGTLYQLSRMRPFETWRDFFPLFQLTATLTALTSWTEATPDLNRLRSFVDSGRAALTRDQLDIQNGKLPTLTVMLWLAAYFVRASEHYQLRGDGAAAVATCVRALECYVQLRLYEANVYTFDAGNLSVEKTSTAYALFTKYGKNDGIQGELAALTDPLVLGAMPTSDVLEVIQLRNRCSFAHGVQRISATNANEAVARVKSFIKQAESQTPSVGARWSNLLADAFVMDWTALGPKIFRSLMP